MSLAIHSLRNYSDAQEYQLARIEALRKPKQDSRSIEADDLTAFKRALYQRYIHARHLELLDRKLEAVARYVETGGSAGIWMLIAEMPPRHGKTLTVSRLFPTWFLGRNPDYRIMLVSYGATLANKNSRYARNIINDPHYKAIFPGIDLDRASKAVDAWDIEGYEGGADALGVSGGATGKGAHLLIIDDIVKSRAEAESETIRDRDWDAVNDDLLSRLEPNGAVIIFATRWHEDDAIGRMIKLMEDPEKRNGPVERLRLVALPETEEDIANDPLGRGLEEPMFPQRYSADVLKAIRARIGPYSWSALYQQRPSPADGGLFKRSKFNRIASANPAEFKRVVRFWDLAMSEKTSADYTVGVKMAETLIGRFVILDVQRRQLDWDDVPNFIAETAVKDGDKVLIGFEKKGYMSRAGKMLIKDQRLRRHAIFGYPKEVDKFTNALPLAARVGEDMVDLVDSHFTDTFLDEVCSFPLAANDDQVDGAAGAYEMLTKGTPITAKASRYA